MTLGYAKFIINEYKCEFMFVVRDSILGAVRQGTSVTSDICVG